MRNIGQLRGSVTALVTPFSNNAPDLASLARLCERQIAGGTAALVICGTTGEAPALSPTEQVQAIRVAVSAAGNRIPVIAGCSAASTDATVCLAVAAARYGASALLCAPPAYVKPTQDGIIAHMRAISDAADLPIMLYDVPGRVGVSIADTTIARLFDAGIIFALKDATADLSRPPRLRSLCGEALLQMSGDDATAAAHRAMGGSGCVSVTANVTPALCAALHRAWDDGDLIGFGELRDLLHPLNAALFTESNPIPVKAALEAISVCSGELRLPLTPASVATRERLARLLPAAVRTEEAATPKPRMAIAV